MKIMATKIRRKSSVYTAPVDIDLEDFSPTPTIIHPPHPITTTLGGPPSEAATVPVEPLRPIIRPLWYLTLKGSLVKATGPLPSDLMAWTREGDTNWRPLLEAKREGLAIQDVTVKPEKPVKAVAKREKMRSREK